MNARYTCGNVLPLVTRYTGGLYLLTADSTVFTADMTFVTADRTGLVANTPQSSRFTCGALASAPTRYVCVP